MSEFQTNDGRPSIGPPIALLACVCSAALWHLLYLVLMRLTPSKANAAGWSARLVSTVYATLVTQRSVRTHIGFDPVSSNISYKAGMDQFGYPLHVYFIAAAGYYLWALTLTLADAKKQDTRRSTVSVVHHLSCCLSYGIALTPAFADMQANTDLKTWPLEVFLLAESSTIFLNLRWFAWKVAGSEFAKNDRHLVQGVARVLEVVFLLTFVVVRNVIGASASRLWWQLDVSTSFQKHPAIAAYYMGMNIMWNSMNAYWLVVIVYKLLRRAPLQVQNSCGADRCERISSTLKIKVPEACGDAELSCSISEGTDFVSAAASFAAAGSKEALLSCSISSGGAVDACGAVEDVLGELGHMHGKVGDALGGCTDTVGDALGGCSDIISEGMDGCNLINEAIAEGGGTCYAIGEVMAQGAGSIVSPGADCPTPRAADGRSPRTPRRARNAAAERVWVIHGKCYDLTQFMDRHPGGRDVLERARGCHDVTPLFESYHSMSSHRAQINATMAKYELSAAKLAALGLAPTQSDYTFSQGGFYDVCKRRVKKAFPTARSTKVTAGWWAKAVSMHVLWWAMLAVAFGLGSAVPLHQRIAAAVVAGLLGQMQQFCIMHDASHFALFHHRPLLTEYICRAFCAFTLWGHTRWAMHHVVRHHSFTGDPRYDPDTVHLEPMLFKHEDRVNRTGPPKPVPKLSIQTRTIFLTWLFPGLWFGQVLAYHLTWPIRGKCWRMPMVYDTRWLAWGVDVLCKSTLVGLMLWGGNFWAIGAYICSNNILYTVMILADHDTIETFKGGRSYTTADWGEAQVRHSGDFAFKYPWVCAMFGGINYQIEHHLFPSLNHVHYPMIAPIVRRTCEEFNIPYVCYDGIWDAFMACTETFGVVEEAGGRMNLAAPQQDKTAKAGSKAQSMKAVHQMKMKKTK